MIGQDFLNFLKNLSSEHFVYSYLLRREENFKKSEQNYLKKKKKGNPPRPLTRPSAAVQHPEQRLEEMQHFTPDTETVSPE